MILNIKKARYEARVMDFMKLNQADKYQLMLGFAKESDTFTQLQGKIVSHYFTQKQLGAACCVDSLVLLVDRVLETMEHDFNAAKAA